MSKKSRYRKSKIINSNISINSSSSSVASTTVDQILKSTINFGTDTSGNPINVTVKAMIQGTRIVGLPGSGKSTLMEHLSLQLVESNCGMMLIDPHGSLVDAVKSFLIKNGFGDRIIEINPNMSDLFITAFHPFKIEKNDDIDVIADKIISVIAKANKTDITSTPRLGRYLYNSIYVMLEQDLTIYELTSLITSSDSPKRKEIINNIKNRSIKEEWQQYDRLDVKKRKELIESSENRLVNLIRSRFIRLSTSQKGKSLDFKKAMSLGKVVLVNLSQGKNKIGEFGGRFLASILLNHIFQVGKTREIDKSRPFFMLIDECHMFVSDVLSDILYELRKFHLGLILAHQTLTQIDTEDSGEIIKEALNLMNIQVTIGALSLKESIYFSQTFFSKKFDPDEIFYQRFKTSQRSVLKNVERIRISEETAEYHLKSSKKTNSDIKELIRISENSNILQNNNKQIFSSEKFDKNQNEDRNGVKQDPNSTKWAEKPPQELEYEFRLKNIEHPYVSEETTGVYTRWSDYHQKVITDVIKKKNYPKTDEEFKQAVRSSLGSYPIVKVPNLDPTPYKDNSQTVSNGKNNSIFDVSEKSKNDLLKNSNTNQSRKIDNNSIELSKNTVKSKKVEKINDLMIVPEDYEEIAEQKLMSYDTFIQIHSKKIQNCTVGQGFINISAQGLDENSTFRIGFPVEARFHKPLPRVTISKLEYLDFVKSMSKRYSFFVWKKDIVDDLED